jgi:hypothetical protein
LFINDNSIGIIKIYDLRGVLQDTYVKNNTRDLFEVDLSNLTQGIYIYSYFNKENKYYADKIIIK